MEFYRYYERNNYDEGVKVWEKIFYLVKETPCGYWISENKDYYKKDVIHYLWDEPRWISKTSRKRYAYPTRKEAIESFKMRKKRQLEIVNYQTKRTKDALEYMIHNEQKFLKKGE